MSSLCKDCGERPRAKSGRYRKDGTPSYASYCHRCKDARRDPVKRAASTKRRDERRYAKRRAAVGGASRLRYYHLKGECERCGFEPEVMQQLHIDHIDGDRDNNDPRNLQTLCANCHALKTQMNGDWRPLPAREVLERQRDIFEDFAPPPRVGPPPPTPDTPPLGKFSRNSTQTRSNSAGIP